MRAVVLSYDQIIEFLNENFINTWVSNVELERTPLQQTYLALRRQQGFKPFDKTHPLAQAIMKGWKKHSPSDSLVISQELELMGKIPTNELLSGNPIQRYLTFLQESLTGKLPGLIEDTSEPKSSPVSSDIYVVLNQPRSSQEVLGVFRTPESGYQDYTVVNIDATAFENGGTLTIEVSVGHANPAGSFDLFDGDSKLPTEGVPHEALTSAWGVPPRETQEITYIFKRGQHFKLGATGDWFSNKGDVNAFIAKISIEPTSEENNED